MSTRVGEKWVIRKEAYINRDAHAFGGGISHLSNRIKRLKRVDFACRIGSLSLVHLRNSVVEIILLPWLRLELVQQAKILE